MPVAPRDLYDSSEPKVVKPFCLNHNLNKGVQKIYRYLQIFESKCIFPGSQAVCSDAVVHSINGQTTALEVPVEREEI